MLKEKKIKKKRYWVKIMIFSVNLIWKGKNIEIK